MFPLGISLGSTRIPFGNHRRKTHARAREYLTTDRCFRKCRRQPVGNWTQRKWLLRARTFALPSGLSGMKSFVASVARPPGRDKTASCVIVKFVELQEKWQRANRVATFIHWLFKSLSPSFYILLLPYRFRLPFGQTNSLLPLLRSQIMHV